MAIIFSTVEGYSQAVMETKSMEWTLPLMRSGGKAEQGMWETTLAFGFFYLASAVAISGDILFLLSALDPDTWTFFTAIFTN